MLSLIASLATIMVTVATLRTFVTDETHQPPDQHFTRGIVAAFVNILVGTIVFAIVIGIGFVFLVIPGLFLLVSLISWDVFVAVEGDNFIEAFRRSWGLASGHRWHLFGLGFVVLLIGLVANAVFDIPSALVGDFGGLLVSQTGSALTTVLGIAVLARACVRLTEASEAISESTDATTVDEPDTGTDNATAHDESDDTAGR